MAMLFPGRTDFLTTLLHCGSADLMLLDDVKYDWEDVLGNWEYESLSDLSLGALMEEVFQLGFSEITEAIDDRKNCLTYKERDNGLSKKERAELTALQTLNPSEDFTTYHNYLDTHVYCEHNAEVYKKYLKAALESFCDNTGFEIGV